MYPVIVRRLADLRAEDRIVARDGQRYGKPLRVLEPLGPIEPGSPVQGVHGKGISHDVVVDEIGVSLTGQRVAVDRTRRSGGEGTAAEGSQ